MLPGKGTQQELSLRIDHRTLVDLTLSVPAQQGARGHPERHLEVLHHLLEIVNIGQRFAHKFGSLEVLIRELRVVFGGHRAITLDQSEKETLRVLV